ncbi:hypothetical protein [Embleya sp. AB8]|uniref:hypothetical protein n=1 Tax=Embleya sp. AB8 TaxID=3156304 RepID=UPI003C777CF7
MRVQQDLAADDGGQDGVVGLGLGREVERVRREHCEVGRETRCDPAASTRPARRGAGQEAVTRTALTLFIEQGVHAGEFTTNDALGVALHILVTIDGLGAYANAEPTLDHPKPDHLAAGTAEREPALPSGTLHIRR